MRACALLVTSAAICGVWWGGSTRRPPPRRLWPRVKRRRAGELQVSKGGFVGGLGRNRADCRPSAGYVYGAWWWPNQRGCMRNGVRGMVVVIVSVVIGVCVRVVFLTPCAICYQDCCG